MDWWWIGTVSTLSGAIAGAGLQYWRDQVAYRREMRTRWDETFLQGLAAYLSACDANLRALIRWRQGPAGDTPALLLGDVAACLEAVHERSHVITLLTGDRSHPIRLAAREMRQPLSRLCREVLGSASIDDATFEGLVIAHREARNALIAAAQAVLGVHHEHS
jgi:hypothetical protein